MRALRWIIRAFRGYRAVFYNGRITIEFEHRLGKPPLINMHEGRLPLTGRKDVIVIDALEEVWKVYER
jgi:hypothetical protein